MGTQATKRRRLCEGPGLASGPSNHPLEWLASGGHEHGEPGAGDAARRLHRLGCCIVGCCLMLTMSDDALVVTLTGVCSWESRRSPKPLDTVRIGALLLLV